MCTDLKKKNHKQEDRNRGYKKKQVEISELKNNNIQNGKKKKDELKIRD
jgi:hypothetical protein